MEGSLQTGESSTYNSQDMGSLIELIGKCGGGKFHVLDATITIVFQMNIWSI